MIELGWLNYGITFVKLHYEQLVPVVQVFFIDCYATRNIIPDNMRWVFPISKHRDDVANLCLGTSTQLGYMPFIREDQSCGLMIRHCTGIQDRCY